MYRVLIVSGNEQFVTSLRKQLQDVFCVESCGSGKWALELIKDYSPDIMVLDNVIADLDCISVLKAVRVSGKLIHVIVYSNYKSLYVERQLESLGVDLLVMKPCKLSVLAGHVKGIVSMIENCPVHWDVEQVLDDLLLELGFCVGASRYYQIKETVLLRYRESPQTMMKELYIDVVRKYGGNSKSVEKAVRDGIKAACKNGNPELWNLLFEYSTNKEREYPNNEEFVGRIALFLRQRSRMKPAYKELPAKII